MSDVEKPIEIPEQDASSEMLELQSPPQRPPPLRIPARVAERVVTPNNSGSLSPCTSLDLDEPLDPMEMSPDEQTEDEDIDGMEEQSARWELRRLLGLGFWGPSGTNITPENIYATANISAFASSLSLVCILSLFMFKMHRIL